ncbi:MAG: hypothetical protein F2681_06805 [Actinobacteria bacterium]|jgi:hypothetical protein|uniref:Unannotated protein n=1 Tax=freshwater metagenome TaxID=449393 RepID=A0A6J7LYK2_9ZZZZ|nr:hypothetical protein [Actinomycetota bacterium]MSW76929.1 hypothetical protein [Actinomycetota bacterium]MSX55506.1 hypothetical protein [Actinomycetota bacterium]MSX93440.1 hypothetical protein [Actinomycetota bacterium]MSZ82835.1 hypothetical protein [Actinomycetota bacterium]
MNGGQHRLGDDDWQPATSAPGELYTPEGQIKAMGAFARGATNRNPRTRAYQRSMARTAAAVMAIGIAVIAIISLMSAVF